MAANVETAAYANTAAWHREGVVLDTDGKKGMTVEQALKESGLNWQVEKVPVYADFNGTQVEVQDRFGVQRMSDGSVLGVVGNSWQPVQNHEGFELIQDFMGETEAYIEAAGALDGGRKVWVLAHMATEMQIAGEDIWQYVLFTNGHDGRTSVTAAMTDIRVVCQNTLTWALDDATRIHRVRHTSRATERLAEARTILGIRDLRSEELAKQGEWLVKQEMSDAQFNTFLEELMPITEEQDLKPAGTMTRKRRDEVREVYQTADNLNNIRGTRWGALNAVVEARDYGREFKNGETMLKAQIGDDTIKSRASFILTQGM
jgi:phage/plasmid-like protein (TIGR03299 family)